MRMAFHIRNCVGTRDDRSFAVQWLACTLPCRRFAGVLTDVCARLGADADRYSFTVRDSHPLLLVGLPAHSENLHMSGPTPHRSNLADAFANLTESCSYQNRSPRFAAVSMLNLLYRKSPVISLPTQSGNSSTRSSRSNSTSAITTPFRMPP